MVDGRVFGAVLTSSGRFQTDKLNTATQSLADMQLLARQQGNEITFTCVPPGSGKRQGIDRDSDGVLDGDEHKSKWQMIAAGQR